MDNREVRVVFEKRNNDNGDTTRICSFGTTHFAEWVKLLDYCQKNEIEFWVRDDDESINDKIKDLMSFGATVESFCVSFGSDDVLQTIDVLLR